MKRTLFALTLTLLIAGALSAQPLDRRPKSSIALLKARAKRPTAIAVPEVSLVSEDVAPAFNGESAKAFAAKIHPILMNLCAGCHGRPDAGAFQLKRLEPGYANAQGIERNLAASAKQLDRANPGASPLLVMAVTPHGKSKEAPMFSKAHPAYKSLELWVHWAAAREGSPVPNTIPQTVAKGPAPIPAAANPILLTGATKPVEPAKVPAAPVENFAVQPKAADPGRVNPDDPFDPGAFNRAAHPNKK